MSDRVLAQGAALACVAALTGAPAAEESARAVNGDCTKALPRQIGEIMRLREGGTETGADAASPAEVRFGLAMVINDFLVELESPGGRSALPASLRNLQAQEIRRRRDSGLIDPVACDIVTFMRDSYRPKGGATPALPSDSRPETPRAATRPTEPDPAADRVLAIERGRVGEPATPISASRPTVESSEKVAAIERPPAVEKPVEKPAPPKPPRVPSPKPSKSEPAQIQAPRALNPLEGDGSDDSPAPAVARIESPVDVPETSPSVVPAPVALKPVSPAETELEPSVPVTPEPPQVTTPAASSEADPALQAAAQSSIAELEKLLGSPRYLTRREISSRRITLSDDELRESRRITLEARVSIVDQLRALSRDPERQAAVRQLLGANGVKQIEQRIEQLFDGGPGSEGVGDALSFWRSGAP